MLFGIASAKITNVQEEFYRLRNSTRSGNQFFLVSSVGTATAARSICLTTMLTNAIGFTAVYVCTLYPMQQDRKLTEPNNRQQCRAQGNVHVLQDEGDSTHRTSTQKSLHIAGQNGPLAKSTWHHSRGECFLS